MSEGNIRTELLDNIQIQHRTNSNSFRLRGEWRYSQSKVDEFVADGADILISKIPFRPNYVSRSGEQKKTANLLSYRINGVPTNEDATHEARSVFGGDVVSYPKPEGLLKYLIRAVTRCDDVILDFFAGSGTTASSVWRMNLEDSQVRRFIMVQLPDPIDCDNSSDNVPVQFCKKIGRPANLAELTKEWLRRRGLQVKKELAFSTQDLGFRVFRLDSSNFRSWEPSHDDLDGMLLDNIEHIRDDRSENDILYELLLKLGLDLCVQIETRAIAGKTIRSVGAGTLIACLAGSIAADEVEPLGLGIADWHAELEPAGDATVVFRDSAFADDVAKTNLTAILEQRGLGNVRSL